VKLELTTSVVLVVVEFEVDVVLVELVEELDDVEVEDVEVEEVELVEVVDRVVVVVDEELVSFFLSFSRSLNTVSILPQPENTSNEIIEISRALSEA
jgi:hypothetical protein